MQPSQYDIQREVEALRDLRRRSTTPGALGLDPDLPNPSSPTSPTTVYYADESSSSHEDTSSSENATSSSSGHGTDDPFHLFWVPASVHPEIAPQEFRAFLKEHARNPPSPDGLERSPSSGLGRKKSMLSRQYRPEEHEQVEEEQVLPLRRNRSSLYGNQGPQLTISDLQRLEELAEEASDDPSKLRNILRRSLSLNVSPTAVEKMEQMPDMADEADTPIIIPPPGQILRRAARTKIRKPGLPGDGGGHRFSTSRRVRSGTAPPSSEGRLSSDRSSSDHGDSVESASPRPRAFSNESFDANRRESFSEEGMIYDSYVRDEDEPLVVVAESPPQSVEDLSLSPSEIQPALLEALGPVLQHPQPQHLLSPQAPPDQPQQPSRTPSPSEGSIEYGPPVTQSPLPPSLIVPTPSSGPQPSPRKEKDKKGLFGKWGGDKSSKKANKEKERVEKEKEKESGFFGSLFGGKKNNKDADQSSSMSSAAGREAAQTLLGGSKSSKAYGGPLSPGAQPPSPGGVNNYSRYPIHVERAIYRLSHIKLANPRRPLYEQVLISNLMFWYLGIINKAQNNGSPNGQPPAQQTEQEQREREQRERAEKERYEAEQREKERLEAEQREREMEMKRREQSPRRGPLTKPPPMGAPSRRAAETPVKGPQYDMQHRVMEQEYGYGGGGRGNTSPVGQQYQRPYGGSPTHDNNSMQEHFYYSPDKVQNPNPQYGLPPGAMPPVDQQSSWLSQSQPSSRSQSKSPPRSRSPSLSPTQENAAPHHRLPGRSQSALVTPSPPVNGKIRKGTSAYAGRPRLQDGQPIQNGVAEDEDVPLAVWQQQRRR